MIVLDEMAVRRVFNILCRLLPEGTRFALIVRGPAGRDVLSNMREPDILEEMAELSARRADRVEVIHAR